MIKKRYKCKPERYVEQAVRYCLENHISFGYKYVDNEGSRAERTLYFKGKHLEFKKQYKDIVLNNGMRVNDVPDFILKRKVQPEIFEAHYWRAVIYESLVNRFKHQELADFCGCSRSSLYKSLKVYDALLKYDKKYKEWVDSLEIRYISIADYYRGVR